MRDKEARECVMRRLPVPLVLRDAAGDLGVWRRPSTGCRVCRVVVRGRKGVRGCAEGSVG